MQEKFAFSNFQAARVRCDLGVEYPTVEHAFQAMKSLDGSERLVIAALETPGRAKRAGRKVQLGPDWEQVSESAMRCVFRVIRPSVPRESGRWFRSYPATLSG